MATNKSYRQVLVCMALVVVFLGAGPWVSVVKAEEDIWEANPERMKLTGERIEHLLNTIAEKDPQLAERLRDLRAENPQAFRNEIREIARERFGNARRGNQERDGHDRNGDGRSTRSDRSHRGEPGMAGKPGMSSRGGGMLGMGTRSHAGGMKERMQKRHEDYIKWLEENYPDEAKQLAQLREKSPEKYLKRVTASREKYGQIMKAEKIYRIRY